MTLIAEHADRVAVDGLRWGVEPFHRVHTEHRSRIPIPAPQAACATGLVERHFDSVNSGVVPTDVVACRPDLVTHYSD